MRRRAIHCGPGKLTSRPLTGRLYNILMTTWLSPHGIPVPLAVVARGANPTLGEDFRPVAWNLSPAKPHRQIFARRKRWRRLTTPIDSAGRRRLSPIRLCLTGAAPTNLPSSTPSCAAPPSQRRSQLSYIGDRVRPSSLTIWPRVLVRDRERRADKKERRARGAADDRATLDAGDSAGTQK